MSSVSDHLACHPGRWEDQSASSLPASRPIAHALAQGPNAKRAPQCERCSFFRRAPLRPAPATRAHTHAATQQPTPAQTPTIAIPTRDTLSAGGSPSSSSRRRRVHASRAASSVRARSASSMCTWPGLIGSWANRG
eukprot:CAMPEP_0206020020 /NCGR_PEP_ID=MMETSP1464-20131121/30230_1 /ASSEMBLY_ACC=CAM_ASM_001124 /TAXON_ID=119497 /ORGANISM="Exanthemachrysis gayraliae, Strain RCC1523" /LENGTH=135 /DNA_ID=CAMNT_0053393937 /DNA_START=284 /DNA_END=688 /DNA_ORIENTATION=-